MPDAVDDPHHFDFDLDRGIRTQVVEKLETSPFLPLTKRTGPQASGIYALYFKGQLVYIGKASKGTTKSKRTLRARLTEHVTKISGRQNIALDDMKCRYLTFASEWWVFAAEFALITHYRPEWLYPQRWPPPTSPALPFADGIWGIRYQRPPIGADGGFGLLRSSPLQLGRRACLPP
ncbi:MAG: Eco29kI family restriction endonuclease [Acidobacteria bacterium]|nr:Eco29kI family restriction endonuclease [Acidobacteriota bacterium]